MGDRDDVRELANRVRELLARMQTRDPRESMVLRGALDSRLTAAEASASLESVALEGARPATTPATAVATEDITSAAARALEKADAGEEVNVTEHELASLEAIVQLVGRPAMRYSDGDVQLPPNQLGDNDDWYSFIVTARGRINAVSASVGQVAIATDSTTQPVGTAWRIHEDWAVTNRHVARELVADSSVAASAWKLDSAKKCIVDFNVTDNATKRMRAPIAGLIYCSDDEDVDLAILRLRTAGGLPAPLTMDFGKTAIGRDVGSGKSKRFKGAEVYVVGHPYRQFASAQSQSVFGTADAYKRCSPGFVTRPPREYAFEHDCSTLGGNSGSCVLSVAAHKVVGLHYAGLRVDPDTGMGRANVALSLAKLAEHTAGKILKEGRVA